ncbi:Hint domain-containing protein [Phaeobacter porticola]|uniref:Hint domain protein n=1 Tax=Phaeobacter porticola TaxID=1844006 RepID=A0A1L3I9W3_9RHOB|nr:Hint domain-containing protein [Phaeobacter porticola]APG48898.1 Hint domain protein [Phaeobacter porticola]
MTWLATRSPEQNGIAMAMPVGDHPDGYSAGMLLTQGSLCVDLLLDEAKTGGGPLLELTRGRDNRCNWPLTLRLDRSADRTVTLTLCQPGCHIHQSITAPHPVPISGGAARLVYAWDSPARWGRLAMISSAGAAITTADISSPPPLQFEDAVALLANLPAAGRASGLLSASFSTQIEPLAPLCGLAPEARIATPEGTRPLSALKRGDLVLTPEGDSVPILHCISRRVPPLGHDKLLRLRAPYFGLTGDLVVAPHQRLVVSGADVEYLFGRPDVRLTAAALQGTAMVTDHTLERRNTTSGEATPLTSLAQLILPRHQRFLAEGTAVESLNLGRLRRDRDGLAASAFAYLDRSCLPEHVPDSAPLLRSFDVAVLAERRIA